MKIFKMILIEKDMRKAFHNRNNFEKAITLLLGITSKQVAIYLRNCWLPTLQAALATTCVCSSLSTVVLNSRDR